MKTTSPLLLLVYFCIFPSPALSFPPSRQQGMWEAHYRFNDCYISNPDVSCSGTITMIIFPARGGVQTYARFTPDEAYLNELFYHLTAQSNGNTDEFFISAGGGRVLRIYYREDGVPKGVMLRNQVTGFSAIMPELRNIPVIPAPLREIRGVFQFRACDLTKDRCEGNIRLSFSGTRAHVMINSNDFGEWPVEELFPGMYSISYNTPTGPRKLLGRGTQAGVEWSVYNPGKNSVGIVKPK